MTILFQISQPEPQKSFALFDLGFRPFFLLGSLLALLSVIPWVLSLHGISFYPIGGSLWWHQHEMLFGFAYAIIVGFLLTAAQNWTGVPSPSGLPLIVLVLFWVAARLLLLFGSESFWWLALCMDFLVNIGVVLFLARMILRVQQWRNFPFIVILSALALLNFASYWLAHLRYFDWSSRLILSTVWLIAIIMNIMGGRVIPFFTERATSFVRLSEPKWLLSASNIALLGVFFNFATESPFLFQTSCIFAGVLLFYRFSLWGWQSTKRIPLLWSLHLCFAFLPLSCTLLALGFPRSGAIHLLTIASMSGLILSMMSRVILGHTGRPLIAPKGLSWAYALVTGAAIVRSLAAIWPNAYLPLIDTSLLLWSIAWSIFIWRYSSMLIQSRVDGKRG